MKFLTAVELAETRKEISVDYVRDIGILLWKNEAK